MFYIYKHPTEDVFVEVEQSMNDKHVYFGPDGLEWLRVWTVPNMGVDTKINPFSDKQFVDKTSKPGTYGDLLDRSKEWSAMRAEKRDGIDPIKQAVDDKWSKDRGGRKLPKKLKDLEIAAKINK